MGYFETYYQCKSRNRCAHLDHGGWGRGFSRCLKAGSLKRASESLPQRIAEECRRIRDDCRHFLFEARRIATLADELRDEVYAEVDRRAFRQAQAGEVFGVHGFASVESGSPRARATARESHNHIQIKMFYYFACPSLSPRLIIARYGK